MLFNAKAILIEEKSSDIIFNTLLWGGVNEFHTFPKDISSKVNIKAWLEFELVYFETSVSHFNHYILKIINIR